MSRAKRAPATRCRKRDSWRLGWERIHAEPKSGHDAFVLSLRMVELRAGKVYSPPPGQTDDLHRGYEDAGQSTRSDPAETSRVWGSFDCSGSPLKTKSKKNKTEQRQKPLPLHLVRRSMSSNSRAGFANSRFHCVATPETSPPRSHNLARPGRRDASVASPLSFSSLILRRASSQREKSISMLREALPMLIGQCYRCGPV